jgi:hypothetical protein
MTIQRYTLFYCFVDRRPVCLLHRIGVRKCEPLNIRSNMDFVERWLSISPDGRSGSFEAGAILAVLIVTCVLVFRGWLQTVWYKSLGNVAWPK